MSAADARRYLLLQVRDESDPMRPQEVGCFAAALGCPTDRITPHRLLDGGPPREQLNRHDVVLIGGSGDYSAAEGAAAGDWLDRALDALRELHALGKPTFASCWGFQAMARALGGRCLHDPANAELGPVELSVTDAGREDPVFGELPRSFLGHAGHEDRVADLPPEAVLLASSARVAQQAFAFPGKPIYATQFHPELTASDFFDRIAAYPRYVEQIAGVTVDEFRSRLWETREANHLLRRFTEWALG